MLKEVGRESEYTQEELKPLAVSTAKFGSGKVKAFPKVDYGWHVACAYNQWGIDGKAKMIICDDLQDMNELVDGYNSGGALRISWYAIPDTHFVKIMKLSDFIKEESPSSPKP